ncbi:hypothetical protein Rhe02_26980 [Rhizocola hellebori]|uniref:Anti-sigma-D factor RsdA sigma factor binding region domain-containing protein n=1 Tax=Rhizocola hellebori TaxID=1392758 RepID=A0A8J3VG17_9ACTN|nr:hypothetical protein [Rhizocola hellebori]GIH04631.1 hypothetical protein Rhe02_26980 [Rhizocola hellebori]
MTIDNDDALLDALGRGEPAPEGDVVANLLAAWQSEISDIDPAVLRPATPTAPQPRRRNRSAADIADLRQSPGPLDPVGNELEPEQTAEPDATADPGRRAAGGSRRTAPGATVRPPGAGGPQRGPRRGPRPLIVAIAAALLAFGGVAGASATAEPGSPLWPIAKLVWSDKADSKVAEKEAQRLLGEARQALADNRAQVAIDLVGSAGKAIARVTTPAMKQRLQEEADEILAQALKLGGVTLPQPGQTGQPTIAPPPGQTLAPSTGASPTPSKTGLLPPILPSILPTLLPSLPLLG